MGKSAKLEIPNRNLPILQALRMQRLSPIKGAAVADRIYMYRMYYSRENRYQDLTFVLLQSGNWYCHELLPRKKYASSRAKHLIDENGKPQHGAAKVQAAAYGLAGLGMVSMDEARVLVYALNQRSSQDDAIHDIREALETLGNHSVLVEFELPDGLKSREAELKDDE